jgi:hypothetical protein
VTIAHIILAHKNPERVARLARRLEGTDSRIYVHVDRGASSGTHHRMRSELKGIPGLSWLPSRYTHWGSFALVKAALSGLRQAIDDGADYAVLLSGQDYPIKPAASFRRFLSDHQGQSFIRWYRFPSPEWPSDGLTRLTRWHFHLEMPAGLIRTKVNNFLIRVFRALQPERPLPLGVLWYGGPQWWCLHRDAMLASLDFGQRHPKAARFLRHVRIPDEAYFQTALLNSVVHNRIVNRSLTCVDWNGPPYPRVLRQQDLPALRASDAFFARKFDGAASEGVLDAIDKDLPG